MAMNKLKVIKAYLLCSYLCTIAFTIAVLANLDFWSFISFTAIVLLIVVYPFILLLNASEEKHTSMSIALYILAIVWAIVLLLFCIELATFSDGMMT